MADDMELLVYLPEDEWCLAKEMAAELCITTSDLLRVGMGWPLLNGLQGEFSDEERCARLNHLSELIAYGAVRVARILES